MYITIQTHPTQIVKVNFLTNKKQFFSRFLNIIGVQIELPITFFSDLACD